MPILTPEERLGQRVAERYRLQAVLSTGGMSVLFRALDEHTDQPVAIKMLKPAYLMEQDSIARFLRETRIAAALRHPNIASVLDVVDEARVPLLVLELLSGQSLDQELDQRGVLPFAEALSIALPIASALAAAHEAGIIHRDVKPGNIHLSRTADGTVVPKLLDFGIAKNHKDDFATQTGLMVGTPGYMAPEQASGGECGPYTDVWGVGAVLYRCLTGSPPHAGNSVPDVLARLVREAVPPLVAPGMSKSACATIDRALSRDPHRRYPTISAFARALSSAFEHSNCGGSTEVLPAILASSESPLQATTTRFSRSMVVGGIGAALIIGWVSFSRTEPRFAPVPRQDSLQRAASFVKQQATFPEPAPTSKSDLVAPPVAPTPAAPRLLTLRVGRAKATTDRVKTPASAASEMTEGLPVATEW